MIWPLWIGFVLLILVFLALDLGVFNRKPHVISAREALGWTVLWVVAALAFDAGLWSLYDHHILGIGESVGHSLSGREAALEFLAAYLVEKSLSLDNIFVIALVFNYFRVPSEFQHRVLFWGILGALVLRGVMISGGLVLIDLFSWTEYLFGALLLYTAYKMLGDEQEEVEPEKNAAVRLVRRWLPITPHLHGQRFFIREGSTGKLMATPLCLTLVLVETTDVLFAVDSIPAVFTVTRDPFLAFTSNVFAILGLRSLYFALAAILEHFRDLKTSLVVLLAFIGVKMLLSHHYPIPTTVSLAVIAGVLLVGVLSSLVGSHQEALEKKTTEARALSPEQRELPHSVQRWFVSGAIITLVVTTLFALWIPQLRSLALSAAFFALVLQYAMVRSWISRAERRVLATTTTALSLKRRDATHLEGSP